MSKIFTPDLHRKYWRREDPLFHPTDQSRNALLAVSARETEKHPLLSVGGPGQSLY